MSVIRHADGYRLVTNRDEDPRRAAALAPAEYRVAGGARALYPRDPSGGGTWVGVNEHGVMVTLLNGNPDDPVVPAEPRSRGLLVTDCLAADSLAAASERLAASDWTRYRPCRLLVLAPDGWRTWWWNGGAPQATELDPDRPQCFASSGLGDELVAGPRRILFDEMLAIGMDAAQQDRFHAHRWDDRPELSVNMWREDACTVSVTAITLGGDQARLRHHPAPPHRPGADSELTLAVHRSARR